jgi:hypothetical protein
MDPRVKAIRDDVLVGSSTASVFEYCYSDEELAEELDRYNILTPREAVQYARDGQEMHLEQGLNQRWGEDDDPELLAYRRWMALVILDKHPIAC